MKKTNDTRYFFILLSNGDTIYFSVEKENEIYKIYCEEFIKAFNYDKTKVTPAYSIEFTKDNFTLKDNTGTIIYNLKDNYKKLRNIYEPITPEIKMIYIDNDIRPKLLERGQMLYDESAYDIPGLLYEPMKIEQKSSQTKVRRKNKLF